MGQGRYDLANALSLIVPKDVHLLPSPRICQKVSKDIDGSFSGVACDFRLVFQKSRRD
tara:strand:- start:294 stop:467 length:174 start_codon:yes stop_codon:yes gene_type:complete